VANLEEDVALLQRISRNYTGETTPIWITELAGDSRTVADVHGQAGFVVESHARAKAAGVQRLYWFSVIGGPYQCHRGCRDYSLVNDEGSLEGAYTPKPSYTTYAAMTRQLSETRFLEKHTNPVNEYVFEASDGTPRRVVWSSERTTVTVQTADPVSVTDLMGNTRTLEPVDGEVYLTVGPDPLYLSGAIDDVESGSPVGITGGTGAAGDVVPLDLRSEGVERTVAVDGKRFTVGADASRTVRIPARYDAERPVAVATVRRNGQTVGRLTTALEINPDPVAVSVRPGFERGETTATVGLENLAQETSYTPSEVRWQIGNRSGTTAVGEVLSPGASRTVSLDTSGQPRWQRRNASVTVTFEDQAPITETSVVGFSPVVASTPTVDGALDEYDGHPAVDFVEDGAVVRPNREWGGPNDQSGRAHFAWDEEYLYLALDVTDDTHAQPFDGQSMWKGDSVQVALSPGSPTGTAGYYGYIVGLTDDGPQVYRESTIGGGETRVVDSVDAAIERDDGEGTTRYEVAIPWSEIDAIDPEERRFSLSLVVNENDGNARLGWMRWGKGIAESKNPALFQPMTLVESGTDVETDGTPAPDHGDEQDGTDGDDPTPTSGPGLGVLATLVSVLLLAGLRRRTA
jgi:hypothetical protein